MADSAHHQFIVVIPVADRPRMLENCIRSLINHLERHPLGASPFDLVSVLIVDDSAGAESIEKHRQLARSISSEGLQAEYFGLEEQGVLLSLLGPHSREALGRIVGTYDEGPLPGQKGASVCRNLALLHLARRRLDPDRTLIWFVDSDEEFTSLEDDGTGTEIRYFHEIDRIFSKTPMEVVTGKVFGDPPVAPAVMIGGLLEDLEAFLLAISRLQPGNSCVFHAAVEARIHDAAYNDLRSLFGFSEGSGPFPYRCPHTGPHDVSDALASFATMLPAFFHGRHPTRRISSSSETSGTIAPARTVYTGNYVIRPSALKFFIPFAPLKLRMAGPVLGRLLRAQIGDRFVSAPLPLRHRRVLPGETVSEFRSGVKGTELGHNLARDFEAQFWGDVMLFGMEMLIQRGYPKTIPDIQTISDILSSTARDLRARYNSNLKKVLVRSDRVLELLQDYPFHGWTSTFMNPPVESIQAIVLAIKGQFDHPAFASETVWMDRKSDEQIAPLAKTLFLYSRDVDAWLSNQQG